jgi:hypothetical protein
LKGRKKSHKAIACEFLKGEAQEARRSAVVFIFLPDRGQHANRVYVLWIGKKMPNMELFDANLEARHCRSECLIYTSKLWGRISKRRKKDHHIASVGFRKEDEEEARHQRRRVNFGHTEERKHAFISSTVLVGKREQTFKLNALFWKRAGGRALSSCLQILDTIVCVS